MNRLCIHAAVAALVSAALACGSPQREVSPTLPGGSASSVEAPSPTSAAQPAATDESAPAPPVSEPAKPDPWWDGVTLACPDGTSMKKQSRSQYEAWCEKPDGTKHGPMASWTPERVKYGDATYQDGALEGAFTLWHSATQKYIEFSYKGGKENGPYKSWHTNGQLAEQGTNVDGKAHGQWEMWHANGNRAAAGEVKEGKRQGEWTLWDPAGKKLMVLTYLNDEIKGAKRYKGGKALKKSQMASGPQCDAVVTKIEQFAGPGALDATARTKVKQDCQKFMTSEEATCLSNASTMNEMPKCLPDIAAPGAGTPGA